MKSSTQHRPISVAPEILASLTTTSNIEQELIDVIGAEATLNLERAFAASYLYIPAKAPSPAIIRAIGFEPAKTLVAHFGCGDIWIPRMLLLQCRDLQIMAASGTGKTPIELAAKFRLTIPNIKRILREKAVCQIDS